MKIRNHPQAPRSTRFQSSDDGDGMNRTLAAAAAAAWLLSTPHAGAAQAQEGRAMAPMPGQPMHGGKHGMAGGWGMPGAGWDALTLTSDQRTRIDAIHRDLRARQSALMARMHANMHAVRAYRDGRFDEAALRSAYAEGEKIHRQMFENRLDAQRQIDALLTPQQRQQLSQPGR
jgi:Spy/CpxP family protein refolding chaperone